MAQSNLRQGLCLIEAPFLKGASGKEGPDTTQKHIARQGGRTRRQMTALHQGGTDVRLLNQSIGNERSPEVRRQLQFEEGKRIPVARPEGFPILPNRLHLRRESLAVILDPAGVGCNQPAGKVCTCGCGLVGIGLRYVLQEVLTFLEYRTRGL